MPGRTHAAAVTLDKAALDVADIGGLCEGGLVSTIACCIPRCRRPTHVVASCGMMDSKRAWFNHAQVISPSTLISEEVPPYSLHTSVEPHLEEEGIQHVPLKVVLAVVTARHTHT